MSTINIIQSARSSMHAASQLPGRGPLMWMMPLHLHISQKSDYDMIICLFVCFDSLHPINNLSVTGDKISTRPLIITSEI